MKCISKTMVFILATLLIVQPCFSWAGTGARVIPQGKVSILEEGKEVTQFQSELPLPEGTMMLCNGKCVVQTQSLQLVAQDQAVFALAEGKARWDLTVKSGQVDFAMRPEGKPISFHTPLDTIQMERAVMPASGTGMVRGSVVVSKTDSNLVIHEGTLQVMGPDGTMLVNPGQAIRLVAAGSSTAGAKPGATADETWTIAGITAKKTTWLIGTAATVVVIGLAVGLPLALSGGGDDDKATSPPSPVSPE